MRPERYTFLQAIARILLSVVLISGLAWSSWGVYRAFLLVRKDDPKYRIRALVQTGPEREALKSAFLEELIGLSADQPQNLYAFDLNRALERLYAFPLIVEAKFQRIPPQTLYLDYKIRKPIAYLHDRTNTAMDSEWVLIPVKPFFSPKRLPRVYWGFSREDHLSWGDRLDGPKAELIQQVFQQWESLPAAEITLIDLSKAFDRSLGQRKVVVGIAEVLEKGGRQEKTLILNPDEVEKGMQYYRALRKQESMSLLETAGTIDLRIRGRGIVR